MEEGIGEKLTGYLLLIVGIAIIGFSLFNIYQVFNKQIKPVEFFSFPSVSIDPSTLIQIPGVNPSKAQKAELLPGSILSESSNLFAHIFFMGFVVNVGYKIASLGVQMLRPVKVNLKQK